MKYDKNFWIIAGVIAVVVVILLIIIGVSLNKPSSEIRESNNESTINVEPEKDMIPLESLQARISMATEENFNGGKLDKIIFNEKQKQSNPKEEKDCAADGFYHGLKIDIWSIFDMYDSEKEEIEGVSCVIEEMYDGSLNQKITGSFDIHEDYIYDSYRDGISIPLSIDATKKPLSVIYSVVCIGDKSGNSFTLSKKLEVEYYESYINVPKIWC